VFLICKACVDGFDYYTIALIAISFCGAGKRDCPRWTIKFRRWKARSFLESFFFFFFLSLTHLGWQSVIIIIILNSTDDNYAFAEWWAAQQELARKCYFFGFLPRGEVYKMLMDIYFHCS
jgi:hypothetical protein